MKYFEYIKTYAAVFLRSLQKRFSLCWVFKDQLKFIAQTRAYSVVIDFPDIFFRIYNFTYGQERIPLIFH